jgi:hypothetical protein
MTDKPEEPTKGVQAQDKGEAKPSGRKRGRPPGKADLISLHPLSFEEAVRGLLQVKMEPEEKKGRGAKG